MLAYINEEAYQKTLETNQTWFYSRSRDELWHKGETSGHTQEVVSIKLDCDQDTLLIEVVPNGPACHTGAKSCFFETVKEHKQQGDYDDAIFKAVIDEVKDRKKSPRSEEHTSELQSRGHLVCRLLLEKKKKKHKRMIQ